MKKINGVYKWILFYLKFCFLQTNLHTHTYSLIQLHKENIMSITKYKKNNTHTFFTPKKEKEDKNTDRHTYIRIEQQIFKQT